MECLQLGYEAPNGDLRGIKSQWLKYNHAISKAVKAMTVDKRSGIYKSVCACAPNKSAKEWRDNKICQAHIFTSRNKVSSVNLEHQCSDTNPGRKRQYSVSMISLASKEILKKNEPVKGRGKTVQKYAEAARNAGFELGLSQAYKVLQWVNEAPIETHIGHYFFLSSILRMWKRADPWGTYELETAPASWDENLDSFRRLYLAPSFASYAWQRCRMRCVTLNSSFRTGGHFSHTILLAVTYDADDDIIILATGICDEESPTNWVWFVKNLIRDFPGIQLMLSGSKNVMENSDLDELLTLVAAKRSWCIRGLLDEYPVKLTKDEKSQVVELAMASTKYLYDIQLQRFRQENAIAATWFDERKELFATYLFLEEGHARFGIIEDKTNSHDITREIMDSIANKPIATILVTYIERWLQIHKSRQSISLQHQERHQQGLCLSAYESFTKKLNEAAQHHVKVVFRKDGIRRAYVSYSKLDQPLHRLLVSADTSTFQVKCPCQQGSEMGSPCVHGTALLQTEDLKTEDSRWFHERFHASTLCASYSPPAFPNYSCLKGNLTVVTMAPPDHGRHGKKNNRTLNKSSATKESVKVCRACGEKGHTDKTCPNPSTEYQFERFATRAKKWADEQTDFKAVLT